MLSRRLASPAKQLAAHQLEASPCQRRRRRCESLTPEMPRDASVRRSLPSPPASTATTRNANLGTQSPRLPVVVCGQILDDPDAHVALLTGEIRARRAETDQQFENTQMRAKMCELASRLKEAETKQMVAAEQVRS